MNENSPKYIDWFLPITENHSPSSDLTLSESIRNFVRTQNGTYQSVVGPTAFVLTDDDEVPAATGTPTASGTVVYGSIHGIWQGKGRVLLHTENFIWEWFNRQWRVVNNELPNPTGSYVKTQFVEVDNGIIILAQGELYIYDFEVFNKLGFDTRPSPPTAHGPSSGANSMTFGSNTYINSDGYAHNAAYGHSTAMDRVFRLGRIGSTSNPTTIEAASFAAADTPDNDNVITGWLEPGEMRYKVAFMDAKGNISATSDASVAARWNRQMSTRYSSSVNPAQVDNIRIQLAVEVPLGPPNCVARIIYRTKDLMNDGDGKFYELPLDAVGSQESIATIPDNVTVIYPDNIPVTWLRKEEEDVIPRPRFNCIAYFDGSLWGASGKRLYWSVKTLHGTFLRSSVRLFDADIVALFGTGSGLLVLTTKSTHLVVPNQGFYDVQTPMNGVGCSSQHSCASVNGVPVWYFRGRFYAFAGKVDEISKGLNNWTRRATHHSRVVAYYDTEFNEYRAWVPLDGGESFVCLVFDGIGWRHRDDVNAVAVSGKLVAGYKNGLLGVWVLDRGEPVSWAISTSWLLMHDGTTRHSPKHMYLMLSDEGDKEITVEINRDFISTSSFDRTKSIKPPLRYLGSMEGFTLDTSIGYDAKFFTMRVDVKDFGCDTMQFKLSGTGRFELVGIRMDIRTSGKDGGRNQ